MSISSSASDLSISRESGVVVVKLGSSSVTRSSGPDATMLSDALDQASKLQARGFGVILVTSGAKALGSSIMSRWTLSQDQTVPGKVASAFGQPILMDFYRSHAEILGTRVAQILVGYSDLVSSARMESVAQVLRDSMKLGIIPIINGNDPTDDSTSSNDAVAASVAIVSGASHLIFLTDIDGVYRDISDLAPVAHLRVADIPKIRVQSGGSGTGGIRSKLYAAEIASLNGIVVRIAAAAEKDAILRVVAGGSFGTEVSSNQIVSPRFPQSSRARWIGGAAPSMGVLTINLEAESSISAVRRSSLFASGLKRVKGSFEPGDVIDIRSPRGVLIARGRVNLSSQFLRLIRATKTDEVREIIRFIVSERAHMSDSVNISSRVKEEFASYSRVERQEISEEVVKILSDVACRAILNLPVADLFSDVAENLSVVDVDNLFMLA